MALELAIMNETSQEDQQIISSVQRYDAPFLQEKLLQAGTFNSPGEYKEVFTEFKKYAALSQITEGPLGMTSAKVDDVWHQFILFTRQYQSFCEDRLGSFLHHSPHTSQTAEGNKKEGVRNFQDAYKRHFGDIPEIWGLSSSDCSADLCGNDQCGGGGNECASACAKTD